jgi:hypothetical protein
VGPNKYLSRPHPETPPAADSAPRGRLAHASQTLGTAAASTRRCSAASRRPRLRSPPSVRPRPPGLRAAAEETRTEAATTPTALRSGSRSERDPRYVTRRSPSASRNYCSKPTQRNRSIHVDARSVGRATLVDLAVFRLVCLGVCWADTLLIACESDSTDTVIDMGFSVEAKATIGAFLLPILVASCCAAYVLLRRSYTRSVERLIRYGSAVDLTARAAGRIVPPIRARADQFVHAQVDAELSPLLRRISSRIWARNAAIGVAIAGVAFIQSKFPYLDAEAVTISGEPAGPMSGAVNAAVFILLTGIGWGVGRSFLSPFGVWLIPSWSIGFGVVGGLATLLLAVAPSEVPLWIRVPVVLFLAPVWTALLLLYGYLLFWIFRLAQRVLGLSPAHSALWWGWLFAVSTTLIERQKPRFQNDAELLRLGVLQSAAGILSLVLVLIVLPRAFRPILQPGPKLLFLRTFGHARRTQRFLRQFAGTWLEAGPICLLCAPDVAQIALDTNAIAAWLRGQLPRYFVRQMTDLDDRIARLAKRYRDGRYPLVEVACLETTWRQSIQRLVGHIDAAVMDLRSFTLANKSCVFELELLLTHYSSIPVILVVDEKTDMPGLRAVIGPGPKPMIFQLLSEDARTPQRVAALALQAVLNQRRARADTSEA